MLGVVQRPASVGMICREMAESIPAESLPIKTRSLAERLAKRVDLAVGRTRIEVDFEDGDLKVLHRHERLNASGLDRFDPPDAIEG